jgi:translation elongation factor EF-Ts
VRKEDAAAKASHDAESLKALCLLEQPFVKDQGTMVSSLLEGLIAKTGEHVVIRRFVRFAVGEPLDTTTSGACA